MGKTKHINFEKKNSNCNNLRIFFHFCNVFKTEIEFANKTARQNNQRQFITNSRSIKQIHIINC